MAEKKPGLLKRIFRFGKKTEEDVSDDSAAQETVSAAQEDARLAAEQKVADEIAAAELVAAENAAAAEAEAERITDEEAEASRLAAEQKVADELAAAERAVAEKAATEKAEAEHLAAEEAEAARLAAQQAAEEEASAAEQAAQEALAEQERLEAEAVAARQRADEEEAARLEKVRLDAAKEEQKRLEAEAAAFAEREAEAQAERLEQERRAAEKAEAEHLAAHQEKQAAEAAAQREAEEAARLEAERLAAEQAELEERERQAAEQVQRAEEVGSVELASRDAGLEPSTETNAEIDEAAPEPLTDTTEPQPEPEPQTGKKKSWFSRLKDGLARSSSNLTENITAVFTKKKLDEDTLQELEDILIQADLGVQTAMNVTDRLADQRMGKDVTDEEVRELMAEEIESVLDPVAAELELDLERTPHVILVVGVNGSGKTTTIGKLSQKLYDAGFSTLLVAGDTFRAAAIEQLKIWGDRTQSPVVSRPLGSDAAGLAYDAYQQCMDEGRDVMLMDTAGRLQNKKELMDELEKIIRVLQKQDPTAPHTVLLTLDATTGQNAMNQVDIFKDVSGVNGLVMTKLDGTARGGILVAISAKHKLPVYFVGVGESVDDLEPFEARDFARSIAGLAD